MTFELNAAPIAASDHLDSYSRSNEDLLKDGELITSSICFLAVKPHDSGIRYEPLNTKYLSGSRTERHKISVNFW